jgi:hypothetical protein
MTGSKRSQTFLIAHLLFSCTRWSVSRYGPSLYGLSCKSSFHVGYHPASLLSYLLSGVDGQIAPISCTCEGLGDPLHPLHRQCGDDMEKRLYPV